MGRSMSIQGSGRTFLHGYLVIHVKEAKDIPDMENWYSKLYDKKDVTDPFVDVKLGKARYICPPMINGLLMSNLIFPGLPRLRSSSTTSIPSGTRRFW